MEKSTDDQSPKLRQMTFADSITSTGSPVLVAGPTPCDSPAGQMIDQSGPEVVRVNHSATPASGPDPTMTVISGQKCTDLSEPDGQESSSANRSRVQKLSAQLTDEMATILKTVQFGSMESVLTWKTHHTPQQRLIYRLRASTRRTDGSVSGGWPSPAVQNSTGGPNPDGNTGEHFTLQTAAQLTVWPTPDSIHHGPSPDPVATIRPSGSKKQLTLQDLVRCIAWATPSARDHKDTPGQATHSVNPDGSERVRLDLLPRQVYGLIIGSRPARTDEVVALDPAFSRWLMGFPSIWDQTSPYFAAWVKMQDKIERGVLRPTGTRLFQD